MKDLQELVNRLAEQRHSDLFIKGEGGIVTPRVWYCRCCYAKWDNDVNEVIALHEVDCPRRRLLEMAR